MKNKDNKESTGEDFGIDSPNPGADAREKPVSLKPLKVDEALRGLLAVETGGEEK
ncbi:MAG: hypothetical protein ACI9JL_000002 [Paracoccaceae bacterium]